MRKLFIGFVIILLSLSSFACFAHAEEIKTHRVQQFANNKVTVWKTTIYPSKQQELKMHRHEHDHVLIALTNGILKITNNKGQSRELELEQGNSYYLTKDAPHELHTDENMSGHPIEVIVVDLKQ